MAVDRGPDQNITIFCMYVLTMLLCRYTNSTRLVGVSGGRVGVATSMAGGGTALSVLTISSVHLADRGNYTCKPASGGHASVSLHVLEGDYWLYLAVVPRQPRTDSDLMFYDTASKK